VQPNQSLEPASENSGVITTTAQAVKLGRSFKRTSSRLAVLSGISGAVLGALVTVQLADAESNVHIPLHIYNVALVVITLLGMPKFGRWIILSTLAEQRLTQVQAKQALDDGLDERFAIMKGELVASAQQVAVKATRDDESRLKQMIRSIVRSEMDATRQLVAQQVTTALNVFTRRLRAEPGDSGRPARRDQRQVIPFPSEQ
jgi:hypothetical protein